MGTVETRPLSVSIGSAIIIRPRGGMESLHLRARKSSAGILRDTAPPTIS
jgi:hypothetical protein